MFTEVKLKLGRDKVPGHNTDRTPGGPKKGGAGIAPNAGEGKIRPPATETESES